MATFGDLNSFIGIGRLTRDPELRYTPGGTGVCRFSIAINRTYRNQEGNNVDEVLFINIVTWGKQAENCSQFLKKGRRVAVNGELRSNNWQDKEGNKRVSYEINARTVQFLDLIKDDAFDGGSSQSGKKDKFTEEILEEDTTISEDDIPF